MSSEGTVQGIEERHNYHITLCIFHLFYLPVALPRREKRKNKTITVKYKYLATNMWSFDTGFISTFTRRSIS